MKKNYEKPELELILLQTEAILDGTIGDVISGVEDGVEDMPILP